MSESPTFLLVTDSPGADAWLARELQAQFPEARLEWVADLAGLVSRVSPADAPDGGGCPYDLAVVDTPLAWADGLAVVRNLKARWADCPAIVLGPPEGEAELVEALRAGLDDYVLKAGAHSARLPVAVRSGLERRRHRQAMREAELHVQRLTRRLLEAQEAERLRLSRELHDEIGQSLTAIKINLQALQRAQDPAARAAFVQESIATVDRTLQQVRDLSLDLRPLLLDDLGLVAALRWYADRQAKRSGWTLGFSAEPAELAVTPELATACFRVGQEALTNAARHARAQNVRVALRLAGGELRLAVEDDGMGFEVETARDAAARGASLGLAGMQERALLAGGRLDIDSAPGLGTRVRASFPASMRRRDTAP